MNDKLNKIIIDSVKYTAINFITSMLFKKYGFSDTSIKNIIKFIGVDIIFEFWAKENLKYNFDDDYPDLEKFIFLTLSLTTVDLITGKEKVIQDIIDIGALTLVNKYVDKIRLETIPEQLLLSDKSQIEIEREKEQFFKLENLFVSKPDDEEKEINFQKSVNEQKNNLNDEIPEANEPLESILKREKRTGYRTQHRLEELSATLGKINI